MEKDNLEKNRKRTVKTPAQVEALEKFYNEHKYPTEEMKIQLTESIGLSEKQVSGWFCHRRLKDKRLTNGENGITGKQDNKPNGVVHDHGGGNRQDSFGSTKQGDKRNLDTREIESAKLAAKDPSSDSHHDEKCNRVGDPSSGSTSSLQNKPNHQNGDPVDTTTASYTVPKFTADMKKSFKTRCGPSGYLKVKDRVENAAVAAVKRQLGKHYREDGPRLGINFDALPPQAFESLTKDLVEETYNTGEDAFPASADVTKVHRNPMFGQGYDEASNKMRHGQGIPDGYIDTRNENSTLAMKLQEPQQNFKLMRQEIHIGPDLIPLMLLECSHSSGPRQRCYRALVKN